MQLLLCTHNAVEYVERRSEIDLKTEAVHFEQTLAYKQSQKQELGIIWKKVLLQSTSLSVHNHCAMFR
jgi:hypothetical protein